MALLQLEVILLHKERLVQMIGQSIITKQCAFDPIYAITQLRESEDWRHFSQSAGIGGWICEAQRGPVIQYGPSQGGSSCLGLEVQGEVGFPIIPWPSALTPNPQGH